MPIATVFGGSGFLGSHVSDELSSQGYDVRVFDQAPSPWIRPDQEMIVADLLDEKSVLEAASGADVIYNFAALASLDEGMSSPTKTALINVVGNIAVLNAAKVCGAKRFIFASSVYVSGVNGGFYRCSKLAAEDYVKEYHRTYGLNYTILRYGSLYGPRAGPDNGIRQILKRAVETGVIRYEGSPEAQRAYIHVHDAALASVRALENDFLNQNVVLTGHEPMRVFDLLEMLAEIMGIQKPVEFEDRSQSGHYVRTPYSSVTDMGRKYTPPLHIDLGQGLINLIEELRSENKG